MVVNTGEVPYENNLATDAPYRDYAAAVLVEVAEDAKTQLAQGWGRRIRASSANHRAPPAWFNSGVAADKPTTRAIRENLTPLMRRYVAGVVGVSSHPRDEMPSCSQQGHPTSRVCRLA